MRDKGSELSLEERSNRGLAEQWARFKNDKESGNLDSESLDAMDYAVALIDRGFPRTPDYYNRQIEFFMERIKRCRQEGISDHLHDSMCLAYAVYRQTTLSK